MADTVNGSGQGQPTGDGRSSGRITAGMTLPRFKKGKSRPSPFSASDMNVLVDAIQAFLKLKVMFAQADQDEAGNYIFDADFKISNLNSILTLKVPFDLNPDSGTGTANIIPMQVVSAPSGSNEYFTAKLGSFTAADTFTATGSAINVALPWELRPSNVPSGASIYPAYGTGDILWALETSAGQNGVYVSSVELDYMDIAIGRSLQQPAMVYMGTYSGASTYYPGNVVSIYTGSNQGVWVRVGTGATTGTDPVWPMPSMSGGTNTWTLFSLGILMDTVCVSGASKTQYFNATVPS